MIVISSRFRGPPESGYGGYTCGLLAREIAAAVTLPVPPPPARHLTVERGSDHLVLLRDGDAIVAEARPTTLDLTWSTIASGGPRRSRTTGGSSSSG